jgi:hypothetical protein
VLRSERVRDSRRLLVISIQRVREHPIAPRIRLRLGAERQRRQVAVAELYRQVGRTDDAAELEDRRKTALGHWTQKLPDSSIQILALESARRPRAQLQKHSSTNGK